MFPLGFPFSRLHRAWKGERVLDPFCGRGTTNFAARLRGLESVGVDSNPVAAAIAAAKLVNVRAGQVTRLAQSVLSARREPNNVPQGLFWDLCFERSTLRELCKMREHFLERCGTQTEMALRALILGILHGPRMKGPSNQMPRSYATKPGPAIGFWKARGIRPCRVDVVDAIHRRAKYVFGKAPAPTPGRIYLADSRYLDFPNAGGPFDWVVTSPPYYGMRSYWPDQWLRNWFLGGPEDVEYRHDHQVSHRSEAGFIDNLARVWREVASGCNPGARMIIRFGAIPSSRKDPAALLKRSLFEAGCGWRVLTIRDAGRASWGKRQSDQFNATTGTAVDEIDLYAVLEG
jgi:predicted RNA methylase